MHAGSEFESDLAKLQANATFGKTMEQVRHRVNIRLICDPHKLTKAIGKVNFRQSEIINDDLVMVRAAKKTVTLNKPISVGFTIPEISKLIMYQFLRPLKTEIWRQMHAAFHRHRLTVLPHRD